MHLCPPLVKRGKKESDRGSEKITETPGGSLKQVLNVSIELYWTGIGQVLVIGLVGKDCFTVSCEESMRKGTHETNMRMGTYMGNIRISKLMIEKCVAMRSNNHKDAYLRVI